MEGPVDLVARSGASLTAYTYTTKTAVGDHTLLVQFLRSTPADGFKDNGGLANAIRVTQLAPAAIPAPPPANTTVRKIEGLHLSRAEETLQRLRRRRPILVPRLSLCVPCFFGRWIREPLHAHQPPGSAECVLACRLRA